MSKKKKHVEEHENLERWLVSYADFITLLFATFVVLYALSQLDIAKFKDLKVSLQRAFSGTMMIQGGEGVMDKAGDSVISSTAAETSMVPFFDNQAKAEEESFKEAQKEIENISKQDGKEGGLEGIDAKVDERGLVINLVDSVFFSSGSAVIKSSAYPALKKVGNLLSTKFSGRSMRVEGHTDNLPMKSSMYPSNWELSSARASSVIRFLISGFNFSKTRFSAVGYADSVPIASNEIAEGRNQNRRVEIVVLRNKLVKSEPLNKPKAKPEQTAHEAEKTKKHSKAENKKDPHKENLAKLNGLSEAAKKLMKETGQSINNVFLYKNDSYDKESEQLAKELKSKEEKNMGEIIKP